MGFCAWWAVLALFAGGTGPSTHEIFSEWAQKSPATKVVDGFGAHVGVTTASGRAVLDVFEHPRPGLGIQETPKVQRDETFTVFLLFQNCQADPAGNCNVTANYALVNPKNEVMLERDLPVWRWPAPAKDQVALGEGVWQNIAFDVEPVGAYKVRAVVKDHVKGLTMTLERRLELVEKK